MDSHDYLHLHRILELALDLIKSDWKRGRDFLIFTCLQAIYIVLDQNYIVV